MTITARVLGVQDCRDALLSIPHKLRKSALLMALKEAAKPVSTAVALAAPVLSLQAAFRNPYRRAGTLRRAVGVKVSKRARKAGDVGVYVTVRQLPGNKYRAVRTRSFTGRVKTKYYLVKRGPRSAKNPDDPFYGRFVQFGTKFMRGRHFFEKGIPKLEGALRIFENKLIPYLQRLNANGKDPL